MEKNTTAILTIAWNSFLQTYDALECIIDSREFLSIRSHNARIYANKALETFGCNSAQTIMTFREIEAELDIKLELTKPFIKGTLSNKQLLTQVTQTSNDLGVLSTHLQTTGKKLGIF